MENAVLTIIRTLIEHSTLNPTDKAELTALIDTLTQTPAAAPAPAADTSAAA